MKKDDLALSLSPIDLSAYRFFSFQMDSDRIKEKAEETYSRFRFRMSSHKEDHGKWSLQFELVLEAKSKDTHCNVNTKIKGFFTVIDKSMSETKIKNYLERNGARELYTIVKARIADESASTPYGQIFLPSVNFEKIESKKRK